MHRSVRSSPALHRSVFVRGGIAHALHRCLFGSLLLALAACGGSGLTTAGVCSPACGPATICVSGICEPVDAGAPDAGGGCTADSQCAPGICDLPSGTCQPASCVPTCAAWETCSVRTCTLTPGRCETGVDCPAAKPICDPSHTCVAPALTPPATLAYGALIVTSQAYAPAFQELARLHTLTGVPTQVATVEELCAAAPGGCSQTDACHDTAKVIKDALIARAAQGLHQVVLGGDSSIVPSRQTRATYSNALYGVDYDETFYSDYYFSDLSQWDTNGDCVYGDPVTDSPGYLPALGVTRISVSSPDELQVYLAKAKAYLTAYDLSRINTALFLSNIATEVTVPVVNVTVPVDSALYFQGPGRTLSLLPASYDVTRLYSSLNWPGSSPLTVPAEETAIEQGYNLIVHSGHGDEVDLTVEQDGSNEFSGDMGYALQNTQYPILISCACEAATFADGDGCAGQQFLTAPAGGGVGYLGNSTIGLGIAGGMQLIDALLRYAFSTSNPLVGEAVMAGHLNLPTSDAITIPNVPVVGSVSLSVIDPTSWNWTQKAATYLGDGLLPIYTDPTITAAPSFSVAKSTLGDFTTLTFTPSDRAAGTLAVALGQAAQVPLAGGATYEITLDGSGAPVSLTLAGALTDVTYGFSSRLTLAAYQSVTLP